MSGKLVRDLELQAMHEIAAALESLAPEPRQRVLDWLNSRFAKTSGNTANEEGENPSCKQ